MKVTFQRASLASAALLCVLGMSSRADGAAIISICNDLACTGGDDFTVQDNSAQDSLGATGLISFSLMNAFGYSVAVNTSQSKPMVGSATAPQLDLAFVATTNNSNTNSIFLYVSDTDFMNPQTFTMSLGGTNSGGSGSVTGRSWGASNNTALSFSGANLLSTIANQSGTSFSGTTSGSYNPAVNPYSLTIGVAITRTSAGTTTGDLNFQTTAIPEPGSLTFFGIGLAGLGFGVYRRRSAPRD